MESLFDIFIPKKVYPAKNFKVEKFVHILIHGIFVVHSLFDCIIQLWDN